MVERPADFWSSSLVTLVAALLAFSAGRSIFATTTFTSVWAGGTTAPGDTVVLKNGLSVSVNVVTNGTLRFNHSGTETRDTSYVRCFTH